MDIWGRGVWLSFVNLNFVKAFFFDVNSHYDGVIGLSCSIKTSVCVNA